MGAHRHGGFFLDLEAGAIDDKEFCVRMSEACGREVGWEEAQWCWLGFIRDVPPQRLRNLAALKGRYHLGLLSNTNPFIMAYVQGGRLSADGLPLSAYFHSLFLSYRMKACKPSPEIYLAALAADGMKAEETVFVDDSVANVEAATALGIHALLVDSDEDWLPALSSLLGRLG